MAAVNIHIIWDFLSHVIFMNSLYQEKFEDARAKWEDSKTLYPSTSWWAPGWKTHHKTQISKSRKSQLHLATELRLPIIPEYDAHFIVESLHPEHWSKGEAILDICKSIPGITRKEDQVSTIQQVRTLEHIDREYPHDQWIHAYTDGFAVDAMKNMGKWRIH